MSEIIFAAQEAEEGGFWARASQHGIFTQGEDWNDLRELVRDAVNCHFEKTLDRPKFIRLRYIRGEILPS